MDQYLSNFRRSKLSYSFVLYSIIMISTDFITNVRAQNSDVIVEPREAVLTEGESINILCKYNKIPRALEYCRIIIPGENTLNLNPKWSGEDTTFPYWGEGLENGHCGVRIKQGVHARNNGKVTCYLGIQSNFEPHGEMNLVVAVPPEHPEIKIAHAPRGGIYDIDQPLEARCIVKNGRPAANITWFLDDEPIYNNLQQPTISEFIANDNTTLFITTQDIQLILTPKHNGRKLICRAQHIAIRNDKSNQAEYQLLVKFQPQPLPEIQVYGLTIGSTAIINVTIEANPKPKVEWMIDGNVISQGQQNSRYEAYEPIYLGNGMYNVTLSIAGLTMEDTGKRYNLKATNELGYRDYSIRISSLNMPENNLNVGAIIGIIIVVLFILIIISLITFARVTRRWCFSGASHDTNIGRDSEAQINPHQSDEFDGKEHDGVDVEHIDIRHQSEEVTPPVTDKLESQRKADIKNGHQNGKEVKKTKAKGAPTETSDTESSDVKVAKSRKLPKFNIMFKKHSEKASKHEEKSTENENLAESSTKKQQDDENKEEKQLVYAELVLKPTDEEIPPQVKPSTEYAEIAYVQRKNQNEPTNVTTKSTNKK